MERYLKAVNLLLEHPQTLRWPQLQQACQRALTHKPVAWDFPLRACQATGGDESLLTPALAAMTCAHMGILLVDDLLDEDPRGLQHQIGVGRAANLSTALLGMAADVLQNAQPAVSQPAIAAIVRMQMDTAYGQELDVQNPSSEEDYWAVAHAKSSPYFATGLYLGALFAGAGRESATQCYEFGALFGEMLQIHDDLNDCLSAPANVDWLQGRSPLPILYAELAPHGQQTRFKELRSQVNESAALQEAQSILVSSGAISYCINELILREKQARQHLSQMQLKNSSPLGELLDQMLAPVQRLLARVAR